MKILKILLIVANSVFCGDQFKIAAAELAKICEGELFQNLPDLEEMITLVHEYNQPEVVMEKGLFTVFRQV